MRIDVVIFGGGIAGLWLLDELTRLGRSAVLLEAAELGCGQTVASQGIIHGGLKYTLQGLLTRSAEHIREMPAIWRECLAGQRQPDLSATPLRAESCLLWRTDSVTSRLGLWGAKFGLQVTPETLAPNECPPVLAKCPGHVARLPEQVICPVGLLKNLAARHQARLLKIDPTNGLTWDCPSPGQVRSLTLNDPGSKKTLQLTPRWVVLTAGAGNAALRASAGLETPVMQRRPLHVVLGRGSLPVLNGHCVDGAKTRVTITSAQTAPGQTVWQVGGQVSEDGVAWEAAQLIAHARRELLACVPGLDLSRVEWSTYRVDRAEGRTANGTRPENVQVLTEDHLITAWPTKLALAPRLAEKIAEVTRADSSPIREAPGHALPADWPRPTVAAPPWETCADWWRLDQRGLPQKSAA